MLLRGNSQEAAAHSPDSFVGCHAGDIESYDDFKDFFYPVIQKYHKGFDIDKTKHVCDMDPAKITVELSPSAQAKIISTRIRVARNLSMFPLNPGASAETRPEICDMMEKVYASIDDSSELKGTMFRHTTMSDEQRQGLIDDHFLFRGKDRMQAASGYHEHWPEGRGVFRETRDTCSILTEALKEFSQKVPLSAQTTRRRPSSTG